ncbi:protein prune homolog 2 [Elysia marginata]|uniref:Protein prune homolog 2 n=1 Tax=Elysia marginata TaxID=1093978 RepID=A0AAV4J7R6_9GAST|nr:protein prune homolog 2 [Elysia marginata]
MSRRSSPSERDHTLLSLAVSLLTSLNVSLCVYVQAELPNRKKLHIVIGNESCDLDSAVSAIVYAYYLHQIKAKPGTTYVPILNVPRKNFRLRLETVYFLGKNGIHEQDLTFVSDLDLTSLTPRPGSDLTLVVTLVDHHVLSEVEVCLEPYVVQVFDHRPQDGPLPPDWDVTLEHVGSCCSLIARELLASDAFELDCCSAELLLGTILTDTGNMSASDRIGTPGDHEQLVKLKAFLPPSISATSIYEGIQKAKFDLSSLTVREMLEKDMKIVKGTQVTVVMSSVTKDLEEILCDPDLLGHAREFCEDLPADVVIIMTIVMGDSGIRRRCIAVYSPNRVYRDQLTDVIAGSTKPNLDLQPITVASGLEDISAFVQNNLVISRKGVLPLVRNFLTGEVTSSPSGHDFFSSNISDNAAEALEVPQEDTARAEHEEMRRHINLAKAHQCEQFRTSQDRYDLAAVGSEALISPSLSSDSDLGNLAAAAGEHALMSEFSLSHPDLPIADSLLAGPTQSDVPAGAVKKKFDGPTAKGDNVLIDFGGGGDGSEVPSLANVDSANNSENLLIDFESQENQSVGKSEGEGGEDALQESFSSVQSGLESSFNAAAGGNVNGSSSATPPIVINCHEPFQLMCPANISDTMMTDFFSSSMPTSGQGSKVPSYPETPPNSYMGSSFSLNRETQLPSFNSSEMVKRIQQKKAALAGHSGHRRGNYEDDDSDGLAIGGSGGGGSLVSPAVPQNSYIDSGSGFSFMSMSDTDSGIPRLSSSDALMERVNEKRSQFEWSVESREDNEDDINDAVGASGAVGIKMLSGNSSGGGSLDPPVPYTPQNSYVEGGFDSYSRSNLPSMNSAEMVAKIRAKQSAMFGSNGSVGSSSRVSRSSHGSDDSGGCRSPDVLMASGSSGGGGGGEAGRSLSSKASRGASLDSPQQPYTPQNSYRDSMGLLEYRNRLPDLNEVAERLSTEKDVEKSNRGKDRGSTSDDNREDREDELEAPAEGNNVGPNVAADSVNNLQPLAMSGVALLSSSHLHHQQTGSPRKSSSRSHSDSQNTMSDVDSLMSVSTDVGTPLSDNVVATGLASQILRGEMALNGRKDTTDSDVFAPSKPGEDEDDQKERTTTQEPDRGDDKRKHLKFSLNQDPRQIIPNGPVAEEDLIYVSGAGQATGFNTHSISREDLFSPVEHSRDDLGFVNIAENIVAESIAAALNMSDITSGPANNLRWMDQISSEISVSPENVVAANLSASILHEGSDRWQSEPKVEENLVSRNVSQNTMQGLAESNKASSSQGGSGFKNTNHVSNNKDGNNQESKSSQGPGEELPGTSDQNLSDAALNELAYEIAHELIQNVLENFPEISGQLESEGGPAAETRGNGRADGEAPSRRVGVVDNSMMAVSSEQEDTVNSLSSSELRKFSTDSNSSASTSCSDRKWSRDTDSAMTIIEDQVVTSFPERQEQEEEIKSFPGRKFSKSEDYPARRFSREDNASRRSSKINDHQGDEYEDIKVPPDGLETDYLPNMDPLQGNLDIIDSNFSNITDTDREVVEGESFRKVSGQELGISHHEFHENEETCEAEDGQQSVDVLPGQSKAAASFSGLGVVEKSIMKKEVCADSVFEEGGEQRAVPRTKKKIRVSFSEDIEDEAGDFNASSSPSASAHSPRSTLKSPPPFAQLDADGQYEGGNNAPVAAGDGDNAPLLDRQGRDPREIYYTTAGRISIASGGGELDQTGSTGSVSSASSTTRRDRHQVGSLSKSLGDPDVFDVTPDPSLIECADPSSVNYVRTKENCDTSEDNNCVDSSSSNSLTFFQPPETSRQSSKAETFPAQSVHNPPTSVTFEPPCVNSDPCVDNPSVCRDTQLACSVSASASGVVPETDTGAVTSGGKSSNASSVTRKTAEPCAETRAGVSSSAGRTTKSPKLTQVSGPQPVTFDPLSSGRGSALSRNLSNASYGSVKGAVYSEEWQDDDIAGIAAQSGIAPLSEDHQRKKIRPDPNFARHIADDDEGVDDDDDDDDDEEAADNNSDIGDLEWESYYAEGLNAIIVFYGCHLPSRRKPDYSYIMNHLFHYVVHTLEELVADDYVIVYFHGSTPRHKMPGLGWLRRCYQSIDRRLKKNLKGLLLVHPTLWLRTIVTMTRPFISSKFSSKLRFVRTLEELNSVVPMDNVMIPDAIAHYDIYHRHLPSPPGTPGQSPSHRLESILRSNPHFLEEQDEREKREMKEEKARAKQREKERKRHEKEKRKEEKQAAKEEKRRHKNAGRASKDNEAMEK